MRHLSILVPEGVTSSLAIQSAAWGGTLFPGGSPKAGGTGHGPQHRTPPVQAADRTVARKGPGRPCQPGAVFPGESQELRDAPLGAEMPGCWHPAVRMGELSLTVSSPSWANVYSVGDPRPTWGARRPTQSRSPRSPSAAAGVGAGVRAGRHTGGRPGLPQRQGLAAWAAPFQNKLARSSFSHVRGVSRFQIPTDTGPGPPCTSRPSRANQSVLLGSGSRPDRPRSVLQSPQATAASGEPQVCSLPRRLHLCLACVAPLSPAPRLPAPPPNRWPATHLPALQLRAGHPSAPVPSFNSTGELAPPSDAPVLARSTSQQA